VPANASWASIAILLPTAVALVGTLSAVDLAYHVRLGDQMLRTGRLVRVDDMTFSVPGEPWLDLQWGAQIVLAATHRLGEWTALATLRGGLIAATLGLVFMACRRRGASSRVASFLTVGAFVLAAPGLEMRPQLLAVPLFAATVLILTVRRSRPGLLWLIPALTVAWANLHGSFPLSLLLVGLAIVEDRGEPAAVRRLLAVGGLAALGTFVTPFGPSTWTYLVQLSTHPVVREAVSEWAPMSLDGYPGYVFFLSVLGVGAVIGRRGKATSLVDLLTLGSFFVIALPAIRGMLWWGLAMPVVLAGWFEARSTEDERRGAVESLIVLASVLLVVAALPLWRFGDESSQVEGLLREAPQPAVVAAVQTLPPGSRVAVDQPWASWFEYAAPDLKVFVDPRIELFPEDVWDDYAQLRIGGYRWREALDRWDVDAVVLDTTAWPLDAAIREDPAWRPVHDEDGAAVYVRS
jgi:hypothetical protein